LIVARRRLARYLSVAAVAAAAVAVSCAAQAQAPSPAQPRDRSSEPGRVEQRFDPPELRRVQPGPVTPEVPAAVPDAPDQRFVLTAVAIEGATAYPLAELAPLYEHYLGREIAQPQIEAILAAITAKYRTDGYVLSRAIVPPQQVALGVLAVRVVEGYVERVSFAGDAPDPRGPLREYARKITAERPLTMRVLERYLFLMSDLPGVTVTPDLREIDEGSGAFELAVRISRRSVQPFAQFDNRGTRSIGPLQSLAGVSLNSLVGRADRTRLRGFTVPDRPRELRFVEAFHDEPVGAEGARVSLVGSRSLIDTERRSDNTPLEGESTRFALGGSYPLIRERTRGLILAASIDGLNAEQAEVDGSFDDRVRSVRANAQYSFLDEWGGPTTIDFGASQGLDILGARESGSPRLSRPNGRSDYTKFNGFLNRVQPLVAGVGLDAALTGQYALSQLLSSEEFAVGGGRFGRGYDPAEVSGNDGVAASFEVFYAYSPELDFLSTARVYAFYDIGAAWSEPAFRESVASAGLGLRIAFLPQLTGSLEWAVPLTRSVAGEREEKGRLFFSLSAVY
jgi:hemolysin activation/secretion protein